jgi:predicted RNase H-like nuclease
MRILFTGFDSAWGGRQRGAICNLAGEVTDGRLVLRMREQPAAVDWDRAIDLAANGYNDAANHVVGIDQGLVVTNSTGMRPVERSFARALMRDYGCGAHASNYGNATCYGPAARIWDFIEALDRRGYRHEPLAVAGRTEGRHYFECYPHPALIGLFDLTRTLPYKVSRRDARGWGELLTRLRSLAGMDPPVQNVTDHVPPDMAQTKSNEDLLDSLIAAYAAAYFWWFGTAKSIVLGGLTDGYIVTPCNAKMRGLFLQVFDAVRVNPPGLAQAVRPAATGAVPPAAPRPASTGEGGAPHTAADPDGAVELTATDTGNLWCRSNPWMRRDRCTGWRLLLRLIDLDAEPVLTFVPFNQHGDRQGGMKPADEDTKLVWEFVTQGATRTTPRTNRVLFEYLNDVPSSEGNPMA